jgi:hypothetical protein
MTVGARRVGGERRSRLTIRRAGQPDAAADESRPRQTMREHALGHAETRAKSPGLGEFRLLTDRALAGNVRLYQSVGFRIDRTEPPFDSGTTVHMSKKLARDQS